MGNMQMCVKIICTYLKTWTYFKMKINSSSRNTYYFLDFDLEL